MALAQADPADARRQALEADALARHVEPAVQVRVVGDQFLDLGVGLVDVFGIAATARPSGTGRRRGRTAGARRPARSPGNRTRSRSLRPTPSGGCCCRSRRSGCPASGTRASPRRARASISWRRRATLSGLRLLFGEPLLDGPADRQVAVHRIVRAGLVGDRIGAHAAFAPARGRISAALPSSAIDLASPAFVYFAMRASASSRSVGLLVDVARAQAHVDARSAGIRC